MTYADSHQQTELVIPANVFPQGLCIFQFSAIWLSYSLNEAIANL